MCTMKAAMNGCSLSTSITIESAIDYAIDSLFLGLVCSNRKIESRYFKKEKANLRSHRSSLAFSNFVIQVLLLANE